MNDKKKQIEELASLMADCNTTCDECFEKLESVMAMKIKEREKHCQAYMFAKTAVEQGYRKIPEDSVVLTKQEVETLKTALQWYMDTYDCKPERNTYDDYEEYSCNGYVTDKETAAALYKAKKELSWFV